MIQWNSMLILLFCISPFFVESSKLFFRVFVFLCLQFYNELSKGLKDIVWR
jgi:hypothetical protein